MPTPVTSARQCLTTEAAFALDEAVSVARRRGHTQTMSLHAIYSLFSLPNSSLREACTYARNSAYSPVLQFKAMELSLSVSLNRIPSARPPVEEPPVSNSLMAAIRRSQAYQKRHPDNYDLVYHQIQIQLQQQSGSAVSCVKVELQHLILAMLDDPVVSRVFGEAGFRSCDIKMGVMRLHPCFNGFRTLCNRLPDEDVNHKRICDILVKNKARNPLLVGVCAYNAMKSFSYSLSHKSYNSLPLELSGISSICIEKEVSEFVLKNPDDTQVLKLRFKDIAAKMANESTATKLIVNIGDLHSLLAEHSAVDSVDYIILQVTELLAAHVGKLWLIGSVINYEMYLKFVANFPSIENDWDLQLLPISAHKPVNTNSRSPSLMESFIPFGGFFTTPDSKCSLSSNISRGGHLQESTSVITTDLNGGGLVCSDDFKYCPSLPSWLKVAELGTSSSLNFKSFKAKDENKGADHSTQQSSSSGSTSSEQHNNEKFKMLFRGLSQRFPQQEEAICLICKTLVSSPMAGESQSPHSACPIGGKWLALVGPQSHYKRSIVGVIAELLWGEHGNIVYVDLNSSINKGVRGKTDVDYIADTLNKKPFSVVFFEDVDKADVSLRTTLSRAVRTGKFMDSHGRDVSASNAIFLAASDIVSKNKQPIQQESKSFNELRILKATERVFVEKSHVFKRKLADADVCVHEQLEVIEAGKRVFKQTSDSRFDLNLPASVDSDLDQMIDCHSFDDETHCLSPKIWLEEFMDHMNEIVEFKI